MRLPSPYAKDVTFSYKTTDTHSAVCTWTTGEGTRGEQTHDVSHATSTAVNASIAYDARTRNQITGFNLTGSAGEPTETGTVPVAGEPCMGNEGHDGLWTSVTQTGSAGGLFVNWNGRSIAMPNTPPVITTVA